jgi:hypothetical protein
LLTFVTAAVAAAAFVVIAFCHKSIGIIFVFTVVAFSDLLPGFHPRFPEIKIN